MELFNSLRWRKKIPDLFFVSMALFYFNGPEENADILAIFYPSKL